MFASLNRSSLIMLTFCYIKICIIFTNADDPCPSDRDHMNKLESIIFLCPSPLMSPPIPLEVNISNMIHHCQLVPISQTVLKLDPLPLDREIALKER